MLIILKSYVANPAERILKIIALKQGQTNRDNLRQLTIIFFGAAGYLDH